MTNSSALATVATMAENMMTRLSEIRIARRLSSAELARRAKIDPSHLSKMESGKRGIRGDHARRLAGALGIDVKELHAAIGERITRGDQIPEIKALENASTKIHNWALAGDAPPLSAFAALPRDVPIFATKRNISGSGFVLRAGDGPVDYERRPAGIAGMRQVFAIYCPVADMAPWRQLGELVYVNEVRDPVPGCHVIAVLHPTQPGGEPQSLLRKLVSQTESRIELEQYEPRGTILVVEPRRVLRMYRVMEWPEVIGV